MAQASPSYRYTPEFAEPVPLITAPAPVVSNASYIAFRFLYFGFILLPLIAGLDKFFHLLSNWTDYLSPFFAGLLGGDVHTIMMGVGAVEIFAALLVAVAPQIGGYLVAIWLWGIILNLLLIPAYFDIALRDFGLSLAALALAQLARLHR